MMGYFLTTANGLLMKGVSAVFADDSFTLSNYPARNTRETADRIAKWILSHQEDATAFEKKQWLTLLGSVYKFNGHRKK